MNKNNYEMNVQILEHNTLKLSQSMVNALNLNNSAKIDVVRISNEIIVVKKHKKQCMFCHTLDDLQHIYSENIYLCKDCVKQVILEDID